MGLELAKAVVKVRGDSSQLKPDLQRAGNVVSSELQHIQTKLLGMAARFGAAIGGIMMLRKSVNLAANFEEMSVSFEVLLGSAERAKKVMKELFEFTAKTPFQMPQVQSATRILLAMGIEADNLMPTLKMLGDVASGTGKGFASLAVIFGQIRGAGRLMGQDLLQLINAGVPIIDELAKMTGKASGEIKEMVSKGEISFEMVEEAFKNMTKEGGRYNDMMIKQSKTYKGLKSTLSDNINLILTKVGKLVLPILKKFTDYMLSLAELGLRFSRILFSWIGGLISAKVAIMAFNAAAKVTAAILSILKGLSGPIGWAQLAVGLTAAAAAIVAINAALSSVEKNAKAAGNAIEETMEKTEKGAKDAKKAVEELRKEASMYLGTTAYGEKQTFGIGKELEEGQKAHVYRTAGRYEHTAEGETIDWRKRRQKAREEYEKLMQENKKAAKALGKVLEEEKEIEKMEKAFWRSGLGGQEFSDFRSNFRSKKMKAIDKATAARGAAAAKVEEINNMPGGEVIHFYKRYSEEARKQNHELARSFMMTRREIEGYGKDVKSATSLTELEEARRKWDDIMEIEKDIAKFRQDNKGVTEEQVNHRRDLLTMQQRMVREAERELDARRRMLQFEVQRSEQLQRTRQGFEDRFMNPRMRAAKEMAELKDAVRAGLDPTIAAKAAADIGQRFASATRGSGEMQTVGLRDAASNFAKMKWGREKQLPDLIKDGNMERLKQSKSLQEIVKLLKPIQGIDMGGLL